MPLMITDGQKNYINELLERADADLADYTGKELEKLTCREASEIIDSLNDEIRARKRQQQSYYRR